MKKKNIPNILSICRICLVPVFILAYFASDSPVKIAALVVYIIAAVTDFLDGYIARRCNMISNLGKVLDPLGDKLMMVAAITCMTIDGVLPRWIVEIIAAKEILMGVGGLIIHRCAKVEIPPANMFGKTSTVVFLTVCATMLVLPEVPPEAIAAMFGVALILMIAALVSYVLTFRKVMKEQREADAPGGGD